MNKKFAKLKSLQLEVGNSSTELNGLRIERHNLNLRISLIKQNLSNDTDMTPLILRMEEYKAEIAKREKKIESLNEEINSLSEKLLKFALSEMNTAIDKLYEVWRELEVNYDKCWRQYQADDGNIQKQKAVKALRQDRTELQEKIMQSERTIRQLQAGSVLSLNKFFKESAEEVTV